MYIFIIIIHILCKILRVGFWYTNLRQVPRRLVLGHMIVGHIGTIFGHDDNVVFGFLVFS